MAHSSILPIALPVSLLLGGTSYAVAAVVVDHDTALGFAKWVAGISNVTIGVAKNMMLADFISLILVRPLSLLATIVILGWFYATT